MVVHHVIRCCCILIPSTTAVSQATESAGPSQAQLNHIVASCPPEISAAGESFLVLYVFVVYKHRLPGPQEVFLKRRLGEWVVRLRANAYSGALEPKAQLALSRMPLWQIDAPRSMQPKLSPTTTEKSPLLSHSVNANGTTTTGPEPEPRKGIPQSRTGSPRKSFLPGFECNKCNEPNSAEWDFVKGRAGVCSKCLSTTESN